MAANDGPVPVRTLAHAARLIREAGQLPRYGITAGEPTLDYRAAARSRPRGHRRRAHPLAAARRAPAVRSHDLRARRRRAVHRTARDRVRARPTPPRREDHHLHRRHVTPTRPPRLRAGLHPQRRLDPLLRPSVDAGDRRRRDRSAARLDLQRLRVTRHAVRGRAPDPDERGRRRRRRGQRSASHIRDPGPRERRDDRPPRALPRRSPADLRTRRHSRTTSTQRLQSSRSAGSPTPPSSTCPPPASRPTHAATCRWTLSFAPPRRTSSPPATSPDT